MFAIDTKIELEKFLNVTLTELEIIIKNDDSFLYFENAKNIFFTIDKDKTLYSVCFQIPTDDTKIELIVDTLYRDITARKNGVTVRNDLNDKLCYAINEIFEDMI